MKGVCVMGKQNYSKEKKVEILKESEQNGIKVTSIKYGLHVSTLYIWRKRYSQGGQETLPFKSGGKNKGVREIEEWKQKEVLKEQEENAGYGISQICNQLRRRGITISTLTIKRVLEINGIIKPKDSKKAKEYIRFEAARPLELVQIDIMEFYIHKQRVYLSFLLDDHSRFILNFHLGASCHMSDLQKMVEDSISRYGKMEKLLSDRGFVFHGWKGMNKFEKYLLNEGIHHIHTRSHHPETIGKVERVNKSVQKELLRVKEFKNIAEGMEELEKWIWNYNYKRVHQGLGGVTVPAERFHGWQREVDKGLSKLVGDGLDLSNRELSIFAIKKVGGELELSIMGQKLKISNIVNNQSAEKKQDEVKRENMEPE